VTSENIGKAIGTALAVLLLLAVVAIVVILVAGAIDSLRSAFRV